MNEYTDLSNISENIYTPYAYEQIKEECIVILAKMARTKSYQKQLEV